MGKQKEEPRHMQLNVPSEAMSDIAEIIEESEIDASILEQVSGKILLQLALIIHLSKETA